MSFERTSINIELGEMHSQFIARVIDTSNVRTAVINKNGTVLNAVKEKGKRELYFFTSNEEENDDQQASNEKLIIDLPESVINNLVNSTILQMIHRALYRDAYPFPTERTTMVSLPLISLPPSETESDNAPSPLVANSVRTTRKPMSAIIGKFISMIFTARQSSVVRRKVQGEKTPDIKRYMQLADIIEQKILGGSVVFSKKTPETERDVLFRTSKKVTIELPVASSMIKELSPLVLYLRFIARPNDFVIIDEPEMNLHPEAQVKLTEVLSMMAQAKLKVLITTHSPYVVDHLTNLIKASKTTNLKKAASQFFLKDQTAFIERRLVSVYLFENATAENILQEDGLVNWETFGSISSRVSQIFFDI